MKVLPINNILNINKNYNNKPSFKAVRMEDANSYEALDSYVDETGMHYTYNQVPYFGGEQINDTYENKTQQKSSQIPFITQKMYEEKISESGGLLYRKSREPVMNALYDMKMEELEKILNNLDYKKFQDVTKQPFFMLGLAEIPLNDSNKEIFQRILSKLTYVNVNIMDENKISLLEKVMNAENEPFLQTIKKLAISNHDNKYIVYDCMQKYAFDNIQNPDFKQQCKDKLPISFIDIENDVINKDLILLNRHVQEQMKCGFCDIASAIEKIYSTAAKFDDCYYVTQKEYNKTYAKIVLDIVKKHFPDEVAQHLKHIIY